MAKSIQQLRDPELEVEMIPLGQIDPQENNPNALSEDLMTALSKDIKENGFTQPILVRPEGDRFRLIDGEHRWRVMQELGAASIPAVVIDADDDEAKLRLVTMNRFRGQFVPIKLAYLLADLSTRMKESELRSRLGMEPGELRDHLRLTDLKDRISEAVEKQVQNEAREAPKVVSVVCRREVAEEVEKIIEEAVGEGEHRSDALLKICRAWKAQSGQ